MEERKVPRIEVRYFRSVISTNEVARELLSTDGRNGTMVVSDYQTMGRGRRGRTWFSPPSLGLWATLILSPHLKGMELFTLSLAAAVAICRALESLYSLHPAIQWPNDIYLDEGKLGGILVEVVSNGKNNDHALVGMGVNLNQRKEDFPPELQSIATSLREALGINVERGQFLDKLNDLLRCELQKLYDKGFAAIKEDYCERSNLLHNRVTLKLDSGKIEGYVLDFGPTGELMVRVDEGPVRVLTHGEVYKVWR